MYSCLNYLQCPRVDNKKYVFMPELSTVPKNRHPAIGSADKRNDDGGDSDREGAHK